MVEGPGCKLNGEKLKKRVLGQRVVGLSGSCVDKSQRQMGDGRSPYDRFLGKAVTEVKSLGKELFVYVAGDSCLRVHFLMNGSMRFSKEPGHQGAKGQTAVLQLILTTDCACLESQQKYADLIDLDICSPTFDQQRAVTTIGNIPPASYVTSCWTKMCCRGWGTSSRTRNIVFQALFNAGINPNSTVDELSEELIILLVKMNRDFTKLFYECRRDCKNLSKFLQVYKSSVCPECGARVVQCKVGEYARLTFFCPACQDNT
ncbi:Endonuclease 8-like 3 [Chionoecetes opilio]|uniref:DNA-(apurinic or apyrimidinic site) lyase n=1 Tax=Chionoecetes opilio TaxID=41210 RepID=A0A8J4YCX6_CHIOP|nr:Endonuclease 8-like 3 [Chionoecetes opilio]